MNCQVLDPGSMDDDYDVDDPSQWEHADPKAHVVLWQVESPPANCLQRFLLSLSVSPGHPMNDDDFRGLGWGAIQSAGFDRHSGRFRKHVLLSATVWTHARRFKSPG